MSPAAAAPASADTIVSGVDVVTMDPARPRASAVAVGGGVVLAVGSAADVAPWRGPATTVLSPPGAAVVPGLVDGHLHPVLGMDLAVGVDLTACRTPDQVAEALAGEAGSTARASARAGAAGEWVRGWGLDPSAMAGAPLTRSFLDRLVGDRPALVVLFDAHAALASTAALARAGVSGPVAFDQGAEVVCDPAGVPTGLLREEAAVDLVLRVAPALTGAARRARLRELLAAFAASGLTGAQVMDAEEDSLALYAALEDEGDLPLRLRVSPWVMPGSTRADWLALAGAQGAGGRRWTVAGVKSFVDGTVDVGTAWLDAPDALGQSTAPFWPDPREHAAALAFFAERGVQTSTHAIGDAGVRHVLAALAAAAPVLPGRARHRVEHLETLPDDLVAALAASGVVASFQPRHCADFVRADGSDGWSERLGPERAARGWRVRDVLEAGATVVLGSDWPVAPFAPLGVLASALTRAPVDDLDGPAVGPAQALTPLQALAGMTTAAAAAAGELHRAGRIAVGQRADLTVLGADPTRTPARDLPATPVLATLLDGRLVHAAPDLG